MKRPIGRWVIRLLVGAGFAAMLTGPAPGNVGGCGAPPPYANVAMFCIELEQWSCWHDAQAGLFTEPQYQACLGAVSTECIGFNPGCEPLSSATEACLVYLTDERGFGSSAQQLLDLEGNACLVCQ